MKKILSLLFAAIMLMGLSACGKTPAEAQPLDNSSVPAEVETAAPEATEAPAEELVDAASQLVYSVYVPNDNADGFDVISAGAESISADVVLAELKRQNVLPEQVLINSFSLENALITIDFNRAFAELICSMGTSGELMIMGSVVNTFLDAFQAEAVYFTVDGQMLESGHVVYDFAMNFFSLE